MSEPKLAQGAAPVRAAVPKRKEKEGGVLHFAHFLFCNIESFFAFHECHKRLDVSKSLARKHDCQANRKIIIP